jgi:single-strand DNA-binding protein
MSQADINGGFLTGRLTKDAVLETKNNTPVAKFTVAVNRNIKKENSDEYESAADFFNLALFKKRATGLAPYLIKGQEVILEYHLRMKVWEKDGKKQYSNEIVIDKIKLTGGGKKKTAEAEYTGGGIPEGEEFE